MMQLQTPALRLLVLIPQTVLILTALHVGDYSWAFQACHCTLPAGSVCQTPLAPGGGRQPVAAAGQQRGRLPGLHVHARDMGPIQLQWAPPDQDSEVAQWPKAHKRAVANSDAESCCELWDRRVKSEVPWPGASAF